MHLLRIIIVCALMLLGAGLKAQQPADTVSFEGSEVRLNQALLDLRRDFDVQIAYDNRALRSYRVNGSGERQPLDQLLRKWLLPIGFTFEYVSETYVIFPQNERLTSNDPTRFNFSILGRVMDLENEEPLAYASVAIEGTGKGSTTNLQGYFTLDQVPSDTVVLVCTYVGYDPFRLQLTPETDVSSLAVYLARSRSVLPTAQVTTFRVGSTIRVERPSLALVDGQLADELPGIGEPDIVRTIQLLPGVSGALENSAFIHVRGGAGDENLVTYDGFTIYYLDHFYGLFSAFNTNSIQSVRLHKGVFNPKYGGRASSVLEITGKTGNAHHPIVKADLNLLSAALHVESPVVGKKARLMLSARRSFTDVVFSPSYQQLFNGVYNNSVLPTNDDEVNTFASESTPDFHFFDLTGKLSVEVGDRSELSFSLYNGQDQLAIAYSDSTTDGRFFVGYNDRSQWGNSGFGVTWTDQWNERDFTSVTFGRSAFNSELFGFDSRENLLIGTTDTLFFDRNTSITDATLKIDHEHRINEHTLGIGFDGTRIQVSNNLLSSDGQTSNSSSDATVAAFYLGDDFRWHHGLHVEGGLRSVWYENNGRIYLEPRLISDLDLNNWLTLHGALGRNHQFIRNVRRQDLFLNTSDEWRLAGERKVPVLQTDQFTLGVSARKNDILLSVDAWYKESIGVTEDALRFVSLEADRFEQNLLNGKGWSRGVEALLRKDGGVHSGWLAYTISRTITNFEELGVGEIPAWYDRSHEVKAVYQYRPGKFHANAVFVYASGLPFTPAAGVYDVILINGETEQLLAYGEIYSARLPAYHRLDLAVFYDFRLGEGNASVGLSLYNVYNRTNVRNRYNYLIGTQEEALEIGIRDQVFLGAVPAIQLSLEW